MNRLVCLISLSLLSLGLAAQNTTELGVQAGASYYTREEAVISPLFVPSLNIDQTWNEKKAISFDTDLKTGSFISSTTRPQFNFDGKISVNYNFNSKTCAENDEKYIIGISISPSILINPIFFKKPFNTTTVGLNAEAKIGLLDLKVELAPLELLADKQGTKTSCFDLKTEICIDLDGSNSSKPLLQTYTDDASNNSIKMNCHLFKRSFPTGGLVSRNNEVLDVQKLTYIDANIKYQYKLTHRPLKINICIGLQSATNEAGETELVKDLGPDAYINYYCTTGLLWMIPIK